MFPMTKKLFQDVFFFTKQHFPVFAVQLVRLNRLSKNTTEIDFQKPNIFNFKFSRRRQRTYVRTDLYVLNVAL